MILSTGRSCLFTTAYTKLSSSLICTLLIFAINFQMRISLAKLASEAEARHTSLVDAERQESCEEFDDVQRLNYQETAVNFLIPLNMFSRSQSWKGVISSSQIEL